MKSSGSFLALCLISLLLAGCGTFELSVLPSSTPSSTSAGGGVALPSPSPSPIPPSECPPFLNETVLPENPDDPQSYIGHHYNELAMPEGLIFNGGMVISDDYLTEWVSRPDFDMQFIAQTVCHDASGAPYNTIVDAVKIPKASEGYNRAAACTPVPDVGPVVVFGKFDTSQPMTALVGVEGWPMTDLDFGVQINLKNMRFQPLPLDNLQCIFANGM